MNASVLADLCQRAARLGASDVFLSEGEAPRIRLNGQVDRLDDDATEPVGRADLERLFRDCGVDPATVRDRDAHWDAGAFRFRVNAHRHLNGLGAVLRVIRTEIPTMASLHLPVPLLESWLRRSFGLILITGPTGCGKSTSVAAMIEWLNQWRKSHVITIEDPIEFLFQRKCCHFTQREVPKDVESFSQGLKSALRQSPDVVFLGEIRDYESAKTALQAAETGHLVVSTLHTSTVTETMERLTYLLHGEDRQGTLSLLATQLIGVLAQKLLPAIEASEERHLVTEYFQNEAATRDWILEMNYARLSDHIHGQSSMHAEGFGRSLLAAWTAGRISAEVALSAASRPQELQRAMQGVSL